MPVNYAASRKMTDDRIEAPVLVPFVVPRVTSNKTNDVKFVRKQLTRGGG